MTILPVLLAIVVAVAQLLGALSSISALLTTRTAQGAIAWIVSLNTFPYLAVPAYWVFGRSRFNGYVQSRKRVDDRIRDRVGALREGLEPWRDRYDEGSGRLQAVERLAKLPFTRHNRATLLVDGEATFDALFAAIASAERYILCQFYIMRADAVGRRLQQALLERAARGVRVYVLFDEIGSYGLPSAYLRTLRLGGVSIVPFSSTRGPSNRFQLNFRNHRKVLICDGRIGFLGGLNSGDEYLGRSSRFGPWRDTHVQLQGPVLVSLQLPFVEDWHWATGEYLDLEWRACLPAVDPGPVEPEGVPAAAPAEARSAALVLPSGPADDAPTAGLMVQHAIHSARERLWIASPYFVPDEGVQDALKLAVLRGVDVRILIPDRPDHLLVFLSAFAFLGSMLKAGVRIFRYEPGFLHQKVILVDDGAAAVGTVNLDNRSFRLNFEITAIVLGKRFAADVEAMLDRDFERSREMSVADIESMPIWLRIASRLAYLLAPVQ